MILLSKASIVKLKWRIHGLIKYINAQLEFHLREIKHCINFGTLMPKFPFCLHLINKRKQTLETKQMLMRQLVASLFAFHLRISTIAHSKSYLQICTAMKPNTQPSALFSCNQSFFTQKISVVFQLIENIKCQVCHMSNATEFPIKK
jgi:hypothetical protein